MGIGEPVHRCAGPNDDASCPSFSFGSDEAACTQWGTGQEYYCNSALQLRMYPGSGAGAKTFEDLRDHPWCIPDSVDSALTPGGCVIARDRYTFEPCAAAPTQAIELVWRDSLDALAGYDVELVYTVVPEGTKGGVDN